MKINFEGLYYVKGQFLGYASTCVAARSIKEAREALKEKLLCQQRNKESLRFKGTFQKI